MMIDVISGVGCAFLVVILCWYFVVLQNDCNRRGDMAAVYPVATPVNIIPTAIEVVVE